VLSLSGIDWEEAVSRPLPSQRSTQGDHSSYSNVAVVAEYKGFGPWRVSRRTG
jgi:hypothetical protein